MNNKKLGINYILNLSYQIIAIIIPIITTPYISKVLGVSGVGEYSFTYSIANYFSLFAAMGFATYAQREIAKYRDNIYKTTITFWEIFIVKLITSLFSILLNILLIHYKVYGKYNILMVWWNVLIISTAIDINYLFQGLEEFGKIVYKNILVKIIALFLIFIIVKKPTDVWKYIVIYSTSILLGNLSMWGHCKKYLIVIHFRNLKPWKHLLPSLKLFIPTIATSIYAYLDKTMIGLLANNPDLENGCYEQAEKIVKMATTIIISLGTVMIPRNTSLYNNGKIDELKKNIYFASNYVWAIGLPIMFGIIALASSIVPWFLGTEFEKSIIIMRVLSPIVLFMGFGNVFGLQYLVPVKKDNQWSRCIILGLVVNILINSMFIPSYFSIGAAIGTVLAEGTVCLGMAIISKDFISLKKVILQAKNYLFASICMFVFITIFEYKLLPNLLNTFLLVGVGIIVYFSVLLLLKDEFINLFLKRIKNKLVKTK